MTQFKTPDDKKVHEAAQELLRIHKRLELWRGSSNSASRPPATLLRRGTRDASYLCAAAGRPPTVGFFGESRSGKSFLITCLGGGNESLTVKVGGRSIDFKKDLNAQRGGDSESTGVVCRFSAHPIFSPLTPDCVVARVISHEDLLAALAIGHVYEFDDLSKQRTPDQIKQMQSALQSIETGSKKGDQSDRALLRDVEAVWHSLEHYASDQYLEALTSAGFPETVARLLDRDFEPSGRLWSELVSMLWGQVAQLTQIYDSLLRKLEALGFPEHVEIPLSAVVVGRPTYKDLGVEPNQAPLTDVSLLDRLFDPQDRLVDVHVRLADGGTRTVSLRRAELSALILELTFTVDPPGSEPALLSQADVLDFPGVVPAQKSFGLESGAVASPITNAIYTFRRGKLIRLFLALVDRREINILVLAAPTGLLHATKELSYMLGQWILSENNAEPPYLALALTKSDVTLKTEVDRPATPGGQTGFGTVLEHVVRSYGAGWMDNWNAKRDLAGGPFGETFIVCESEWGRTTNVAQLAKASGVRESFLSDPLVLRHVADPSQKWESFVDPSSFGVDLLSAAVTRRACELRLPERRLEEIRGRINRLDSILRPVYTNPEKPGREDPHGAAERDVAQIAASQTSRVASLLDMLSLRREDGSRLLRTVNRRLAKALADGAREELTTTLLTEELLKLWCELISGRFDDPLQARRTGLSPDVLVSIKGGFAEGVEQDWMARELSRRLEPFARAPSPSARHREYLIQVAVLMFNGMLVRLGKDVPAPDPVTIPPKLRPSDSPHWRWITDHWSRHLPKIYADARKIPTGNTELRAILEQISDLRERTEK